MFSRHGKADWMHVCLLYLCLIAPCVLKSKSASLCNSNSLQCDEVCTYVTFPYNNALTVPCFNSVDHIIVPQWRDNILPFMLLKIMALHIHVGQIPFSY